MNKNKCFGICKETERLGNKIEELEKTIEEIKKENQLPDSESEE